MNQLRYFLPVILLIFSLPLIVQAQRGAGRGGNGTPATPRGENPNIQSTPGRPDIDFTLPENLAGITLPDDLPSPEDIQAIITELELPFSLDDLDLPASSPEAYAVIVGFGQSYPGIIVNPIYAGTLTGNSASELVEGQDITIPLEIETVTSELPVEVQSILTNATGVAYWGIYQDGAAAVYTESDCTANCSVAVDNLQLTLNNGSVGLYTVYLQSPVTDAVSAQNLILSTYPALENYELMPYAIDAGYAFTGIDSTISTEFSATGFLAGVMSATTEQSIIYVVFGVGDGYIELIPR